MDSWISNLPFRLLAPWIIAAVQSSAQFLLSESDGPIVHDGVCLIKNNNFLIVGAIFSYVIPNAIVLAFYSLCYKEIQAIKAGRYFDGNGSLRKQYQQDSEASQTDDEICDNDDVISEERQDPLPEIVQMSSVSSRRIDINKQISSVTLEIHRQSTSFTCDQDNSSVEAECRDLAKSHKNEVHISKSGFVNHAYRRPSDTENSTSSISPQTNNKCAENIDTPSNCYGITPKDTLEDNDEVNCTTHLECPILHKRSETLESLEIQRCSEVQSSCEVSQECPDQCLRQELVVCRVLLGVSITVGVAWAPFAIIQLVLASCPSCMDNVTAAQLLAVSCCGYISAAIQPVLHIALSENTIIALSKLFSCRSKAC